MLEKQFLFVALLAAATGVVAAEKSPEIFFDFESEKLLDEKIEVFTALAAGKNESEIPKFYDVLEL